MIKLALYRQIFIEFWKDPKVTEEMSAEDRYALLYLLTNPHTTQIGIYQITKRQMAFDLEYSTESVGAILERFEKLLGIIRYNPETREIAIKNWGKYNLKRGGKPIMDCIRGELEKVKDKNLIEYVADSIPNETIKNEFLRYVNDTFTISGQEEEKEEEKEEDIDKEKEDKYVDKSDLKTFKNLYEQNIGLINGITAEYLIELSETIDVNLLKRAIEIATDKGKCNLGYIKGIIKQWLDANIRTLEQLEAYKLQQEQSKQKGVKTNGSSTKRTKQFEQQIPVDDEKDEEYYRLLKECERLSRE